MKYYGKAETAAKTILSAFESGNLPAALAPLFISRKDDLPCRKWSWANQLIAAMHGCSDARAFGQWLDVKRAVKKGEHARAIILAPCTKKIKDGDEERTAVFGFRGVPVFDVSQTDGEALPAAIDAETSAWLNNLPWRGVAESWGITIDTFNGVGAKYRGFYRFSGDGSTQAIALGVRNVVVWAHELMHAADRRLGQLTETGQHWRSETVAQLGAAILLTILGNGVEADLGFTWQYVTSYAKDAQIEPITACTRVLKRTCDAVALILNTAETLTTVESSEGVGA
jgi:hypothetical protein